MKIKPYLVDFKTVLQRVPFVLRKTVLREGRYLSERNTLAETAALLLLGQEARGYQCRLSFIKRRIDG